MFSMPCAKNLRFMLIPLLVGGGLFIFTFVVFITAYSFFEYQNFLSRYEITQRLELKVVQQKTDNIFKKVKELLQLTSARIAASEDNLGRMQSILISAPRLYTPQELPSLQSLVYTKLDKPYKLVSRFGIVPLKEVPTVDTSIKDAEGIESKIIFQKDTILSRIPVFGNNKALKGILEIKLSIEELQAFLGKKSTLSFTLLSHSPLLQKLPFAIYLKPPDSFWKYIVDQKNRYAIFFCFFLIVFLLFLCSLFYFHVYFQKAYGHTIKTLTKDLENITKEREEFRGKLLEAQEKYKNCWTSFQSYKRVCTHLNNEKKEQALQICKALDIVTQGLKGTKINYSIAQQFELIQSSLKFARFLSEGKVLQKRKENINVNNLLKEVSSLFAEKMYKSKTALEIACSEDLCFYGDPLLIELILINVIGKAIYRLSRNSTVSLSAIDLGETIFFELKDKGFPLDDLSEKVFKQSFDLFMPDKALKKMCYENDLQYFSSRDVKDFNVVQVTIPKAPLKNSGNNIIRLFQ